MILIWFLSLVVVKDVNTWQLVINTVTPIITFLLVALPQNTQRRTEEAVHQKLNAIADARADLMEHEAREELQHRDDEESHRIEGDMHDLREAVGLEQRV